MKANNNVVLVRTAPQTSLDIHENETILRFSPVLNPNSLACIIEPISIQNGFSFDSIYGLIIYYINLIKTRLGPLPTPITIVPTTTQDCDSQFASAKSASENRICTQQIACFTCGRKTYGLTDGCMIETLGRTSGWQNTGNLDCFNINLTNATNSGFTWNPTTKTANSIGASVAT
jgi:hypothetical protein